MFAAYRNAQNATDMAPTPDNNKESSSSSSTTTCSPPTSNTMLLREDEKRHGKNNDEEKNNNINNNNPIDSPMCRICLQDDEPNEMIAPCLCKGSSKWVHRDCLDRWRTFETDRAFSTCTECHFVYRMQPVPTQLDEDDKKRERRRKMKYYLLVSKDVFVVTLLSQMAIAALGAFIWLCFDYEGNLAKNLNMQHPVGLYYLLGFFALLVILGLYGSIVLCCNGCSVDASLEPYLVQTHNATTMPPSLTNMNRNISSYQEQHQHYANARQRQRQQQQQQQQQGTCCGGWDRGCDCNCYYCSDPGFYGGSDPCSCCCCCCETNAGDSSASAAAAGGHCCGSDCGGGGDDAAGVLLVILLAVAVVLAIIGFMVGIVVIVIIVQRIVQRHIYILHKHQLAQEFQVTDLAEYQRTKSDHHDVEQALPSLESKNDTNGNTKGKCESEEEEIVIPPMTLSPSDSAYLKDLGLMV